MSRLSARAALCLLIDHGAALYFHHNWDTFASNSRSPFALIKQHMLLPFAKEIEQADEELSTKLTEAILKDIVSLIPDDWLERPNETREAYLNFLLTRLDAPRDFAREAAG